VLKRLPGYVMAAFEQPLGGPGTEGEPGRLLIRVAEGAVVEEAAIVVGPALIGRDCRVYAGSLVRGPVILGDGAVVGHGSEVVRSVLLNGAHASHLNYVGDSILGANVNLGAGAVCSNVKLGGGTVRVSVEDDLHDTDLDKLGAILGDGVQLGCNVVASPGTLVGPRTWVYPGVQLRGYYPGDHIVKAVQSVQVVTRRPRGCEERS
jgi:NDP-sugar pyrophosphorylase family protein